MLSGVLVAERSAAAQNAGKFVLQGFVVFAQVSCISFALVSSCLNTGRALPPSAAELNLNIVPRFFAAAAAAFLLVRFSLRGVWDAIST